MLENKKVLRDHLYGAASEYEYRISKLAEFVNKRVSALRGLV